MFFKKHRSITLSIIEAPTASRAARDLKIGEGLEGSNELFAAYWGIDPSQTFVPTKWAKP